MNYSDSVTVTGDMTFTAVFEEYQVIFEIFFMPNLDSSNAGKVENPPPYPKLMTMRRITMTQPFPIRALKPQSATHDRKMIP